MAVELDSVSCLFTSYGWQRSVRNEHNEHGNYLYISSQLRNARHIFSLLTKVIFDHKSTSVFSLKFAIKVNIAFERDKSIRIIFLLAIFLYVL